MIKASGTLTLKIDIKALIVWRFLNCGCFSFDVRGIEDPTKPGGTVFELNGGTFCALEVCRCVLEEKILTIAKWLSGWTDDPLINEKSCSSCWEVSPKRAALMFQ